MKKKMLLSMMVSLIVLSLISAGNVFAAAKGKIVIAQGGETTTLDPHKGGSAIFVNACLTMYDLLIRKDRDGNSEMALATSYKNIDPLTWEFNIRKGVTFHNGDPLTADDVKFSYDRLRDKKTKNPFGVFFRGITEVQVIDEYTVRIITDKADPALPSRVSFASFIVPKNYIEKHGDEYFGKNPVGSGRYKFSKWVKNDHVELEANEKYWGENPATIKTLVFRVIPETGSRIAALQTGEVDIAVNIPAFMIPQLEKDPNLKIVSGPSGRVIFIGFNLIDAEKAGPLMNKKVRQAINYAVDKQSLIKHVLMGSGEELATPLVPVALGYDPTIQPYSYDPAKAKQLLAEAGYPNGFDTEFATGSGRYLMDKQISEAIVGMLSKVGIRAKLNVYEWGKYEQVRKAHKVEPFYMLGWGNTMSDADGTLVPLFFSKSTYSNYVNPELDKMLMAARFEMNPEKRNEQYGNILRYIKDEAPWIFLYQQRDNYGVRNTVTNFKQSAGSERMDCDILKLAQ
ncbi:MAG: ABC transporter substrate-binding protein [Proteobacteria bacterium]|nr:ABC transporter substrate-binding protein [Pseudomonadota bacterium]MBU1697365.1 ABC transporter substrate-binding protein [Pseudomonadota bacterium]